MRDEVRFRAQGPRTAPDKPEDTPADYDPGDDVALSERTVPAAADASPRVEADEHDSNIERLIRIGIAVAIVGAAVQVASQLVNYFIFDGDVASLNVDADTNSFAWASSVTIFAVAWACAVLALVGWWSVPKLAALAAILTFFSLDDIIRVHERVAYSLRADVLGFQLAYGRILWPILFFWRLADQVPARAGWAIRTGLVMLVLAVAAEASSTVLHVGTDPTGTLQDIIQVAIEESLEFAGWALIAAALVATVYRVLTSMGRDSAVSSP
jgi:hypothetical protein